MINLFGPEIHLSVTNSTSIGIMASWIASPIGVVLKQQLLSKNTFHLSLGTIMGTSGYIEQGSIFGGLHWLTATFGDRSTNISFSGGVGYMKWPSAQNSSIMDNQRRIGENYGYNFNDESHPYYVPIIHMIPQPRHTTIRGDGVDIMDMIEENKRLEKNYTLLTIIPILIRKYFNSKIFNWPVCLVFLLSLLLAKKPVLFLTL